MPQSQSTKILVTGATGYVGSHVLKYLNEKGYQTIGIDRNVSARDYMKQVMAKNLIY